MDHVYSKPISRESIQLVLLEGGIQFKATAELKEKLARE